MPCDFSGKTALVTGAASGIGAACVRQLTASGVAGIIAVDRDAGGLEALSADCPLAIHAGDVTDEALWQRIEADEGPIDLAVLNAGIATGRPIADSSFAEWREVLGVNLDGMFLSLRCALRLARDGAAVVLTASVSGFRAEPGVAAYGASKAGVIQLAKTAAKEAAGRGIRVNAIAPGGVDTPIWEQTEFFRDLVTQHGGNRADAIEALAQMGTPLQRFASAQEIAGQILFLLSDDAANITGTVLVSDGGLTA